MKKVQPIYLRLLIISFAVLGMVWMGKLSQNITRAGTLTDVSATMSNSRFSFYGEEVNGETSSNIIDIDVTTGVTDWTTDEADDQLTDVLKIGDSLTFATDGSQTIEEVVDGDTIRIDSALTTGSSQTFYLQETTDLTVVFTTNSYVDGDNEDGSLWDDGYFEVLVPAAASNNADDTPDQGFFDFGSSTASTVSCTNISGGGDGHLFSGTDYTELATANQSGFTEYTTTNNYDSDTWHSYRCNYEDGDANDTVQMTISDLINPVPYYDDATNNHDNGVADTYDVIVRHMNGTTEIDSTHIKIGAVEAVKVSASVLPSLSFEIDGVTSGTSQCGYNTDVTTYADSVPFGNIGVGGFTHAAQTLTLATNAIDGASVTAVANDQLGLNGGACDGDVYNSGANQYTCIWDHHVDGEEAGTDVYADHDSTQGSNPSGERDWANTTTETGFGFSLADADADSYPDFYYNQAGGTFYARHFASAADSQDPQLIMDTDSDPINSSDVSVCYRIIPDSLTAAGDYYNYITYTATAQF